MPAFSGLFAPYWRSDARGAIVGLSRFNTNAHIARATLEAICYQSRDVVEAMRQDSGVDLDVLRVDGGVTANELCMQLQADILGVPVSRPVVAETTALGAAYAAGLAVGFWRSTDELRQNWNEDRRWHPGLVATSSASRGTPAGRRRSPAPSTGSRSADRPRRASPGPAAGRCGHPRHRASIPPRHGPPPASGLSGGRSGSPRGRTGPAVPGGRAGAPIARGRGRPGPPRAHRTRHDRPAPRASASSRYGTAAAANSGPGPAHAEPSA